jgi:hypothetical protein
MNISSRIFGRKEQSLKYSSERINLACDLVWLMQKISSSTGLTVKFKMEDNVSPSQFIWVFNFLSELNFTIFLVIDKILKDIHF